MSRTRGYVYAQVPHEQELERSRGTHHGVGFEELLRLPDRRFFRRKGEPAFSMVGIDGEMRAAGLRSVRTNVMPEFAAAGRNSRRTSRELQYPKPETTAAAANVRC